MSGFPILDLILGMVFVYFMLSLITSAAVEMMMSTFQLRAKVLRQWLCAIFNKEMQQSDGEAVRLGQAIMDHCATTVLSKKGSATSYIDATNFSAALLERISFNPAQPDDVPATLADVIRVLKAAMATDGKPMLSTELRRTFISFAQEATADFNAEAQSGLSELQRFKAKVERWYDTNMDRLEGSLKKRYLRPLTFWIGTIVVLALNADSVSLAHYLYSNPDARAKIVAQAATVAGDTDYNSRMPALEATNSGRDSADARQAIEDLRAKQQNLTKTIVKLNEVVPLGWTDADAIAFKTADGKTLLNKAIGLLATILALILGAPFWFNLINKIVNLKSSGPKPASATDAERKASDNDDQ